jgi:hypothetical protein
MARLAGSFSLLIAQQKYLARIYHPGIPVINHRSAASYVDYTQSQLSLKFFASSTMSAPGAWRWAATVKKPSEGVSPGIILRQLRTPTSI